VNKYLVTLLAIGLAISACASEGSSASLIGSWKLTAYGPVDSPFPAMTDTEAGITFNEDGTVTGTSGCNGFGGEYTVEGDQITFGQITSTLMACEDQIMAQENIVHQVLTGTATYKIEGSTLTLTNNDMVLVFTRGSYP
jgi:heat shock protein HslJ